MMRLVPLPILLYFRGSPVPSCQKASLLSPKCFIIQFTNCVGGMYLSLHSGCAKNTAPPMRGTKPNQARSETIPTANASTLRVQGSIYVGTGLGVRKTPAWVPTGGPTKEFLANILGDQRQQQAEPDDAVVTTIADTAQETLPEEHD